MRRRLPDEPDSPAPPPLAHEHRDQAGGSVARGDATPYSDIDLMVDLLRSGAMNCSEFPALPKS
jgi:hypothetical protein